MVSVDRIIWEWIDTAGGFIRASNWIDRSASPATLEADLQFDSNGLLQYTTKGTPLISGGSPATGLYQYVQDVAVLVFQTVPGTTVRVVVPAPLSTTFGPDSNIVDPTDTNVSAIIAAVTGVLCDAGGNVVTSYISGIKTSRRVDQP